MDLTPTDAEYRVLWALECWGPCLTSQLAECLDITADTVADHLASLRRKGYVERDHVGGWYPTRRSESERE